MQLKRNAKGQTVQQALEILIRAGHAGFTEDLALLADFKPENCVHALRNIAKKRMATCDVRDKPVIDATGQPSTRRANFWTPAKAMPAEIVHAPARKAAKRHAALQRAHERMGPLFGVCHAWGAGA